MFFFPFSFLDGTILEVLQETFSDMTEEKIKFIQLGSSEENRNILCNFICCNYFYITFLFLTFSCTYLLYVLSLFM